MAIDTVLNSFTVIIVMVILFVCLILLGLSILAETYKSMACTTTLLDLPCNVILCVGGALLTLHVTPKLVVASDYFNLLDPYRDCHLQLGLFHVGFTLFFSVYLLEIYRLMTRLNKVQHATQEPLSYIVVGLWVILPTIIVTIYCAVWFAIFSPRPESCMTSPHQNYLFIVENGLLLFTLFLFHSTDVLAERADLIIVYTGFLVAIILGTILYLIRVYVEPISPDSLDAFLATLHAACYILILMAGNVCLRMNKEWTLTRLSVTPRSSLAIKESRSRKSSIFSRKRSRVSAETDPEINLLQDASGDKDYTEFLSDRRRMRRHSEIIILPSDPDELPERWY